MQANTAEDMTIDSLSSRISSNTMALSSAQSWGIIQRGRTLCVNTRDGLKLRLLSSPAATSQVEIKQIKDRHGAELEAG